MNGSNVPEYYDGLLKQFKESKGIHDDKGLTYYTDDFFAWLKNLSEFRELYVHFLKESDFLPKDEGFIAELEKGRYDAMTPILSKLGYNSCCIGEHYQNTFARDFKNHYQGYLSMINEKPFILYKNYESCFDLPNCYHYFNTKITHFICQYPYYDSNSLSYLLSASQNQSLILGIFGNLQDCDVAKKVEWINSIADVMKYYYHVGYEQAQSIIDDKYVYVIRSKNKERRR